MTTATTVETPTYDDTRAEAFADNLVETLNRGALALMISIGHRTGLFDSMDGMEPATSTDLARAADLQERYVREWLNCMVVSGVVDYDAATGTYQLPAEHASCLTRASAPGNLAAFAQYIPLLGSVEDDVVKSFREGGGVPYCAFCRFQEVMAEDSGQSVLPALLDDILPLVPGLHERLEAGIDVVDVGCGQGRALNLMARHYPNSRFTGVDISEEGVEAGRRMAEREGLTNLFFEVRDAVNLGPEDSYDLVCTFDAVHDQADPQQVLNEIARVLRPDGVYLMQDIKASSHVEKNVDHPLGTLLYTISCMHCMTVSLAQGGAGLGAMWGRELARSMLAEAGFNNTDIQELAHDPQNDYYVNRL